MQIADLESEDKKVERSNKTDLNIFAKRTIEIGEYMKGADDLNMAAENHIYEHKHPNEFISAGPNKFAIAPNDSE